jgi:hypothetical protein
LNLRSEQPLSLTTTDLAVPDAVLPRAYQDIDLLRFQSLRSLTRFLFALLCVRQQRMGEFVRFFTFCLLSSRSMCLTLLLASRFTMSLSTTRPLIPYGIKELFRSWHASVDPAIAAKTRLCVVGGMYFQTRNVGPTKVRFFSVLIIPSDPCPSLSLLVPPDPILGYFELIPPRPSSSES